MKKVGIITINDLNNYGNRLQCYALQEFLKDNKIISENIYNYNQTLKNKILTKGKKIVNSFLKPKEFKIKKQRNKAFKKFDRNINYSNYKILNEKCNSKINNEYDYFIVGSDQVWNTRFNTIVSKTDFLHFANNNKRISYAASFGTSDISNNFKEDYFKEISRFKAISVREDSGKNIIKKNTNRNDVEVLIDPTLLLDSKKWHKISKKPEMLNNKKYILCYFLGNIPQKTKEEITRIAKEKKWEIINILDKESQYYSTGPSEFLYLEENAELICTDSFQSSVFAFLYNKPFIIFDREDKHENMNSRLETLISKFKLENRRFNGEKITKENLNHNYKEAYKILEEERKKSEKFLKKALDIE